MWKYGYLYSVFFLLIPLLLSAQDLQIDLYTEGNGRSMQLCAVLKNTTNKSIRMRNYDGGGDAGCLHMSFLDRYKNVIYHGVYIFTPPNEYKKWVDIGPNENLVFKYPVGAIRASYKRASEIKSVEFFCILKYSASNTSFSYMYDRTFTFFF